MRRPIANPPLTIALPDLVADGRDSEFRDLVADLFAAAAALQSVRRGIGRLLGLRGSELALLLAVSRLGEDGPVGIRGIAENLHVAAPNVTAEVNALVARGLLLKTPSGTDSRAVELALTAEGEAMLERLAPVLREVNAALFGGLSRPGLAEVRRFLGRLLDGTPAAMVALER